jgi:hypothetical protein
MAWRTVGLTPERLFFHRFDSFEFTVHVQAKPKVLKKPKKTKLKEKPLIFLLFLPIYKIAQNYSFSPHNVCLD